MSQSRVIECLTGRTPAKKRSKVPAKLDWYQSLTGGLLGLFIILHIAFTSTILFGPDAFDWMVHQSEGAFIFGKPASWITLIVALAVSVIFVAHAALAMRKFPTNYRQHLVFLEHKKLLKHSDTSLWIWQCVSGFALLFLGGAHLITVLATYDSISAASAISRFNQGGMSLFYFALLVAMVVHAAIGIYRLVIKWVPLPYDQHGGTRLAMARIKRSIFGVFAGLGIIAFCADMIYVKLGHDDINNPIHLTQKIIKEQ
jgi:fumarate reductase subunit C